MFDIVWCDAQELTVAGQGFVDTALPYDRLPARAEGVVRPEVWNLSRHSAGIRIGFRTDATSIHARWTLTEAQLAKHHMAATAVSGLDLYVDLGDGYRWAGIGRPENFPDNEAVLLDGAVEGKKRCLIYLPLYNGVSSVSVGVPKGCALESIPDLAESLPILFYGTSITHGASATRPGSAHVQKIGRGLGLPTINLGFWGNGKMEPEVAELVAEVDARLYLIDCLPNMDADLVTECGEAFVQIVRKTRPTAPVLMVEDRTYGDAFVNPGRAHRNETSRAAYKPIYEN